MDMRHEIKYTLNMAEYLALKSRLIKLFTLDAHAGTLGGYRVRSLYFDTMHDNALRDKADGVSVREKFRLRMYDGDSSYIKLEKKMKKNGLCAKRSALLSPEETLRLLSGDIEWLKDREDPVLWELFSKMTEGLRPKTVVEYTREAFVFPAGNVRVTLDSDIRTGLYATGFLEPGLPLVPVFEDCAVLEVKYDSFIPEIVAVAVQVPNGRQTSFSKYAVCRKYD